MQIKDSRFHKVWKKEVKNGFTKLNLGDSKKGKDGEYENWTWFDVAIVGHAKDTTVNEGDTITINSGLISKRKYNEKYYDDIVIFDFTVTDVSKNAVSSDSNIDVFGTDPDGEDIPF